MFTGVSLDQALKYWKNGKEVIVLDRTVKSPSGGYETYSLDELFKNLELLVDVPAVENLEFKQAVAEPADIGRRTTIRLIRIRAIAIILRLRNIAADAL